MPLTLARRWELLRDAEAGLYELARLVPHPITETLVLEAEAAGTRARLEFAAAARSDTEDTCPMLAGALACANDRAVLNACALGVLFAVTALQGQQGGGR
jgi:hypothetical protein